LRSGLTAVIQGRQRVEDDRCRHLRCRIEDADLDWIKSGYIELDADVHAAAALLCESGVATDERAEPRNEQREEPVRGAHPRFHGLFLPGTTPPTRLAARRTALPCQYGEARCSSALFLSTIVESVTQVKQMSRARHIETVFAMARWMAG